MLQPLQQRAVATRQFRDAQQTQPGVGYLGGGRAIPITPPPTYSRGRDESGEPNGIRLAFLLRCV